MGFARQVKVAVIGAGMWGQNLARNFHALGALAAINDAHMDRTVALSLHYDLPVQSLQQILDNSEIEGIVISVPSAQHYELAKKALAAGKHIFVEKPLTLSLASAEDIVTMAEKAERIVMVGHLLQYHPAFLKLVDMVNEGALGELQYIYSHRLNIGRIRTQEDCLWDLAPHDLSMILALVQKEPMKVQGNAAENAQTGVVDTATLQLAFEGGLKAHVFVSWVHPFKEHRLTVVGSKGMAVFDDTQPWSSKLMFHGYRTLAEGHYIDIIKDTPMAVPFTPDEPLKLECQHFLDCLRAGEKPRTGSLEALRVIRVLEKTHA
ncbi:MAG: Gfo/Idh/MocA family oxidoreductase [Alphaproteobacteria bacterium]|nr:Gfo/Idh/MocA family oxidoreductase [Alphaproteobacteria bacterium]